MGSQRALACRSTFVHVPLLGSCALLTSFAHKELTINFIKSNYVYFSRYAIPELRQP
jgi:hypothetical protein